MITLYRVDHCDAYDKVQETLRELVVAHQIVDVEKERRAALTDLLADRELPVIADGEKLVSGEPALHKYLSELTRDMEQWRKYQTDACYVDDQGKNC